MERSFLTALLACAILLCGISQTSFGQQMDQSAGRTPVASSRVIQKPGVQKVKGVYPHGWKRLHPVHTKIQLPLPNKRTSNAAAVSLASMQIRSSLQPQQPIAQNLPLWQYNITASQDGNAYQGYMVGRSPYYNGHRTTTIQAYLVPVILTFPDGTVFDPTAPNSCIVNPPDDNVMDEVQNSPVFQTTDFTLTDSNGLNPVDVGVTQAPDAYQRANFWQYVAPNSNTVLPYHTLFSTTTLPAINITVPSGYGFTQSGDCGTYGVMDYNWWDGNVTYNLIPSLASEGVGPSNLPIFIFAGVVMYLNADTTTCCALGDHGAYLNASNDVQSYVVANFDTTGSYLPDVDPLSDEMSKWIDDVLVSNPTPSFPWTDGAGIGEPCENILETGDPLTGYVFQITMPNGVTFDPQEIVYFSWFYGQAPSIGAGGWYSDQGTLYTGNTYPLPSPAPLCQAQ